MPSSALVTDQLRISNAKNYLADFATSNYYIGIGKVDSWPVELNPEIPLDNTSYRDHKAWFDMIGAKRVVSGNTNLVTPRYNWTTNTVYAAYDSEDSELFRKPFFVHVPQVNGSINVYKCIERPINALGVALPSTVQPSDTNAAGGPNGATTSAGARLADGYIWKFMGTVDANLVGLFGTSQHVPITTKTVNDGSLQFQIQQNAISGAIFSINMVNTGSGYTSAPTVQIIGNGTGATATAVLTGGNVTRINMTNFGAGYTYATVVLTGGGGTGAVAKANIAPPGGHGKDAEKELGAYFGMIFVQLENTENSTLPVNNGFRRIVMVKNPTLYGTSTVATALNYRQTFRYVVTNQSVTPFQIGETVSQAVTNFTGVIVDIDTVNNFIFLTSQSNLFDTTNNRLVTGGTSGATCVFGAQVAGNLPGLQPSSGIVSFIENRRLVNRASDQAEVIQIVIEF